MTTNTKNTFKIGQKFNKTYPVEALANPLRGVPEGSAPAEPKKEEE